MIEEVRHKLSQVGLPTTNYQYNGKFHLIDSLRKIANRAKCTQTHDSTILARQTNAPLSVGNSNMPADFFHFTIAFNFVN